MKMSEARELAVAALAMDSAREIYALCDEFYRQRVKVD